MNWLLLALIIRLIVEHISGISAVHTGLSTPRWQRSAGKSPLAPNDFIIFIGNTPGRKVSPETNETKAVIVGMRKKYYSVPDIKVAPDCCFTRSQNCTLFDLSLITIIHQVKTSVTFVFEVAVVFALIDNEQFVIILELTLFVIPHINFLIYKIEFEFRRSDALSLLKLTIEMW